MSVDQKLWHVNTALKMALGEVDCEPVETTCDSSMPERTMRPLRLSTPAFLFTLAEDAPEDAYGTPRPPGIPNE